MPNVRDMADPNSPNYDQSGHRKLDRSSGVPITGKHRDGGGWCGIVVAFALLSLFAVAALIVGAL